MVETTTPAAARPEVIANFAISLDGNITTTRHIPSGWTSDEDKSRFHTIRALGDAIMAGRGTVEADRMTMTLPPGRFTEVRRSRHQSEAPFRVVVTASGQLSDQLPFWTVPTPPIIVLTTTAIAADNHHWLAQRAIVLPVSPPPLDLPLALTRLKTEFQMNTIVCEGGAALLRSLLEHDLLDQLYLTVAPRIFGGRTASGISGPPMESDSAGHLHPHPFLPVPLRFHLVTAEKIGDEVFTHYARNR